MTFQQQKQKSLKGFIYRSTWPMTTLLCIVVHNTVLQGPTYTASNEPKLYIEPVAACDSGIV